MEISMFKKLLIALFLVSASLQAGIIENWVSNLWKKDEGHPPLIKVLIAHSKPGMVIEVKGKYTLYDPHTMNHISTRFIGKRKYMQALTDGLKWGEEFPGMHQLLIVPMDQKTTTLVDGVEYKGSIYVYDVSGTISVINEIYVEDYLNSLLTSKYAADPLTFETLSALAIDHRTQAYWQVKNPKTPFWDVDATKEGFEGSAVVKNPLQAVTTTKYMVLLKDGSVFNADWPSTFTLAESDKLAREGQHASQILSRIFPGTTIRVLTNQ